jgi:threonine aldolase
LLTGNRGRITAEQVKEGINDKEDIHKASTKLVSLENTSNRGGGSCYDRQEIKKIRQVCDEQELKLHLDGARLFNALVAKGENARDYGSLFHSISLCLSKSLGCPVGSVLMGNKDFIKKARRIRKVFGGGMRQAGFLAAAGIYALENNIQRLQQDHQHARMVACALSEQEFVGEVLPTETNIIIFEVKKPFTAQTFVAKLKEHNILGYAISPTQVRLVTHMDITPGMVEKTIETIKKVRA